MTTVITDSQKNEVLEQVLNELKMGTALAQVLVEICDKGGLENLDVSALRRASAVIPESDIEPKPSGIKPDGTKAGVELADTLVVVVDNQEDLSYIKQAANCMGWEDQNIRSYSSSKDAIEAVASGELDLSHVFYAILGEVGAGFAGFAQARGLERRHILGYADDFKVLESLDLFVLNKKSDQERYRSLTCLIPQF
jgi:hypothetical protein